MLRRKSSGAPLFVLVAYQDPKNKNKTLFAKGHHSFTDLSDLELGDVVQFTPFPFEDYTSALNIKKTDKNIQIDALLCLLDTELAYHWPRPVITVSIANLIDDLVRHHAELKTAADLYNHFQRSGRVYIGRQGEEKFFFFDLNAVLSNWSDGSGTVDPELV